uniref:C2H2-type domain-containing protein n=1 Tax=Clastoptera arizonana TaxID=38151 RepID=A0A1B6E8N9_9HEMI
MPMDIKKEPLDSDSIVQCLIDIKEEPFHLDLKDECVMEIKKEVFDSDLKDECLMDIKKEAIDLDSMDECLIDIPTRNASEGPETDPLEEVEMKEEIFEVRGDSDYFQNQDLIKVQESRDVQNKKLFELETRHKLFDCEFCKAKFNCQKSLITHKQIHNGEKPLECIMKIHNKEKKI